jgi:glycosyltransferase involved in cell wall biosynthesis
MSGDISIVVPIYNEAATLRQLLAAISAQTLCPREVVCVDSGSSDDSVAIIKEFAKSGTADFAVRIFINRGGLPGGNRNLGIREATGEWIAFLDAGLVPQSAWLENLMACVSLGSGKAVYGQCQFDADTPFQKAVCAVSYGCGATHAVLPASLFHRSVFESVGLFRDDLRATEDQLWLRSLENALGPRQVCAGALVYYRHFPSDVRQVVRKWWGYERHAIRAGLRSAGQIWLSSLLLGVMIVGLVRFPTAAIALLTVVVVGRGLISPMLRSRQWCWWANTPSALLLAIGVCALRDATKVVAQASYLFPDVSTSQESS